LNILLVGAGGHARAIVEGLRSQGHRIVAYVDPSQSPWLDATWIQTDFPTTDKAGTDTCVIGVGGMTAASLKLRLELMEQYSASGYAIPPTTHPAAFVSADTVIEDGCIILARAVIQPAVEIEAGVIVNTGAIVEHDSTVQSGAHIGPGAIILGGCTVGKCAMIGAGATVLPGATVPPGGLVKAGARYP